MLDEKKEMEYKEYVSMVKKGFKKKNLNDEELDYLEGLLDLAYFSNDLELNYELLTLYGKINLKKGEIDKAKGFFECSLDEPYEDFPKAAYYGLFKTSVYQENYKEAKKYLSFYDSCFDKNFDMTFYLECLDKLLELTGEKIYLKENYVESSGFINANKAPEKVLNMYNKAKIYFDNEEYELAYVTINKLQNLCEAKNYSFDFTDLLKIIKEICILNEKKNEESIRLVESRKDMDIESKKAILKACIKNPKNVSALIALLNIYISEKNYKEAFSLINCRMDKAEAEKNITQLNLLRKIVSEEYDLEKNEEEINNYLNKAQAFIRKRQSNNAIKTYKEGYEKLSSPIFLFKIAELYYELRDIKMAKEYFVKYMDHGQKFINECHIYLAYISLLENKNHKFEKNYDKFLDNDNGDYLETEKKAEDGYFKVIKK